MKISYNWLKQYIDFDLTAEELSPILTDIGLEVEGLNHWQSVPGGLEGLVVGEVMTCTKHPDADKLKVTTVDVGQEELLNIVCGAPNVETGQKVIVATINTTLYPVEGEPFKIKKSKIRGVLSQGMICAEDEIGLGTSHEGIMVLNPETKVGTPASSIFQIENDFIFDIGLTPNRPDAYSHIGTAKDLMAYFRIHQNRMDEDIKLPDVSTFENVNIPPVIDVEIADNEKCIRYSGISLSDVKIKESPLWLKNRLNAIGVRPINNVVDITNYILHEIGQPLHAFDLDEIGGKKITVKTLEKGSVFKALDEKDYKLHQDDLMICDQNEGMCIAGVFGGIKSGVKDSTTNIFLESANFEAINTRKTSFRHLLRTDAAMRFEKGVDPNISVSALKRAALMLIDLADAKISSDIIDIYPKKIEKTKININTDRITKLIGASISKEEIIKILKALEIDIISENDTDLVVAVPTNKPEVLREADIVEEILRIYGFNAVPIPSQIKSSFTTNYKNAAHIKETNTANWLVANGLSEMMNLSFSSKSSLIDLGMDETESVALLNNLNADLDILRVNSLFSGLETIQHNQNRQNADLKLFEFGKIYWKEEDKFKERKELSIFLTGSRNNESWLDKNKVNNIYNIKKIVSKLFKYLGIETKEVINEDSKTLNDLLTWHVNNKVIAEAGSVKKKFLKQFGLKNAVFMATINWDLVLKLKKAQNGIIYQPLPKFPGVKRDLALLLDKNVSFDSVKNIAEKNVKHILKQVNLFDIYEGEKLEEGKKSYAVSFHFQDNRKTLTDKQVDKIMNQLINKYKTELGATLR